MLRTCHRRGDGLEPVGSCPLCCRLVVRGTIYLGNTSPTSHYTLPSTPTERFEKMESSDSRHTISENPDSPQCNMEPGMQINSHLTNLTGRASELTRFPGNVAHDGDCANPPDTLGANINLTTLPSSTPSGTTSSNPSMDVYVLTYDASVWPHKETTGRIYLLDGTLIKVKVKKHISPATVQPVGVLGVYSSEAQARKTGKAWLYDQLMGLGVQIHRPLPIQDNSEVTEPAWKKSGWVQMPDGNWGYTISDHSRWLGLTVHVTGKPVAKEGESENKDENSDDEDEGGFEGNGEGGDEINEDDGYDDDDDDDDNDDEEDEDDDNDDDDDDDDDDDSDGDDDGKDDSDHDDDDQCSDGDDDGKREYVKVGSVGRHRRVLKT